MAFFIPKNMDFLPKEIEAYALVHTEDESNLLAKLNRETWAKVMTPRMLSGHLQGRVLSMFSKMISPKNILEIGTYTGYSALCMAEGLGAEGQLHTIECDEEASQFAKKYFDQSEYKEKIIQHLGDAMGIISSLEALTRELFIFNGLKTFSFIHSGKGVSVTFSTTRLNKIKPVLL